MSEMVKEWLKDLYETAIEDTKTAIANERLWANSGECANEHCENIDTMEEYIEVLTELKEKIN